MISLENNEYGCNRVLRIRYHSWISIPRKQALAERGKVYSRHECRDGKNSHTKYRRGTIADTPFPGTMEEQGAED